MAQRLTGGCLCGAVAFTAEPQAAEMSVCHCAMCRRWSGGTFMAVDCGSTVEFAEGAPITTYVSSDWGERLFCSRCGSSLVWQTRDRSHQIASAQAFDEPGAFAFTGQIYIDSKPENYAFANQTRVLTEAEFLALFAPASEGDHD